MSGSLIFSCLSFAARSALPDAPTAGFLGSTGRSASGAVSFGALAAGFWCLRRNPRFDHRPGPQLGCFCYVFSHLSGLRHLSSHPGGRAREGVGQASQIPLCRVFVSSQLAGRLRNTVGSGIIGAAESAKSDVPRQSAAANNRLVEGMTYGERAIGIVEDVVIFQEFFGLGAKSQPAVAPPFLSAFRRAANYAPYGGILLKIAV